ncbi:2-methylcitrate dehydratase [Deltaproteobacteria bacterium]|nr:2-methylcitrate dehydratase [Deltaproteobacteria bacterium]
MPSATQLLGTYIADTNFDRLPAEVIREAKRRIADVIGIGLSGSRTPAAGIEKFCLAHGGPGAATIWGRGVKTSPAYAALANGTMTFHLELDDVHRTSHTHPGVSCIPLALALCEDRKLTGRDLITATVIGYDASIRVGLAVSPSIYVDRTFLAPGTLSIFGAAASAAKLLNLDAETAGQALAAAAYYGPLACYESFRLGAGIKDMIMGWGNLAGLYAVELAALGFGGPATALEGDFGFYKTTSARFDPERLKHRLGTYYEIMFTGIKPYACCRQHHAAIDCLLEIRNQHNVTLGEVERVRVRTFTVSSRGNQKHPTTVAGAKYSIPYILAVTLKYGQAWREQFTEKLIADQELLNFAASVEVEADAELDKLYDEKWPSIVEVALKDGRELSARRDLPKGEPEFPCSDDDLKTKFLSLAGDALSARQAGTLWDCLGDLENLRDLEELSKMINQPA